MTLTRVLKSGFSKPVLHLICLMPAMFLVWGLFNHQLGANPVEVLTHKTGDWSLRWLLVTLAISPLSRWTRKGVWLRFRRMLGLYVFFYVSCHFMIWLVFDHSLDLAGMLEDILDRPYISIGFVGFVLLIPLAITSNQASIRWLGRRWRSLHKLVYGILALGILHFFWLVKADYLEPGIYAVVAGVLLSLRWVPPRRRRLQNSADHRISDMDSRRVTEEHR